MKIVDLMRFYGIGAVPIEQLGLRHMHYSNYKYCTSLFSAFPAGNYESNSYRTLSTNVQIMNSVFAQALHNLVLVLSIFASSLFPSLPFCLFISTAPSSGGKW